MNSANPKNSQGVVFYVVNNLFLNELSSYTVNFASYTEVKVVVVFDAMMSGLPTHKETFAGYDDSFVPC